MGTSEENVGVHGLFRCLVSREVFGENSSFSPSSFTRFGVLSKLRKERILTFESAGAFSFSIYQYKVRAVPYRLKPLSGQREEGFPCLVGLNMLLLPKLTKLKERLYL